MSAKDIRPDELGAISPLTLIPYFDTTYGYWVCKILCGDIPEPWR